MKALGIYVITFALAIVVRIVFTFLWSLRETTGTNFAGGSNSTPDPMELKFLFSCIVGGVHGFVVAVLSVAFLTILLIANREIKLSFLAIIVFSTIVGILFFAFYFQLMWPQNSTIWLALSERWSEWLFGFTFDFLTAFISLILVKLYFEL